MINSYHTHLCFCKHAEGFSKDYVVKAIEFGMDEIGISDHMPVPDSFYLEEKFKKINNDTKMNFSEINNYLMDVISTKKLFEDKIKVFVGFECEYYNEIIPIIKELKDKVDYLNLGLHHFYSEGRLYNSYSRHDMTKEGIKKYCKIACEALDTKMFKCFVHPDLFLFGYRENQFDSTCEEVTRQICEAAIRNNVYLEVNCNDARYCLKEGIEFRYPREEFWRIASGYKQLKIVIGSDAHKPERLYDEAVIYVEDWVQRMGLNISKKIDIAKW